MASPGLSELITTTLRNRRGKLADNVLNHIPLLYKLKEKGNTELESGGRTLVEELEYQENSTFKYYDGYEVLDVSASDVFTAAEFDWKQAAVVVSISGKEMRMNAGKHASIRLAKSRIANAEKTMMNNIATGIASDGAGSGSKQVGGLQLLVADTGSGTVGGIAAATYSFWRNQVVDFTSDIGAASSAGNFQKGMKSLWLECVRNGDYPDMIVAGSEYFNEFWQSLTAIQRITETKRGAAGFQTLTFYGPGGSAEVFYDSTIASQRMYFLNTDYIHWRVHEDANFEPLTERDSFNQDAMVRPLIFMGNMTVSNRARQGVLKE